LYFCSAETTLKKFKTRGKLEDLFTASSKGASFRNVAAQFAMLLYASRTFALRLGPFFAARRAHAAMSRLLTAKPELWDLKAPAFCEHVQVNMEAWRKRLLEHLPRVVEQNAYPEAILVVDACRYGWCAAFVDEYGREMEHAERWREADAWFAGDSARSEPEGLYRALCRFVNPSKALRVCAVTDSTTAQLALPKGHSSSFFVNTVCTRLHAGFPGLRLTTRHIPGKDNPCDKGSRTGDKLTLDEWDCVRRMADALRQGTT
jgi:hypothetical protein